jgi:transposase-like protein
MSVSKTPDTNRLLIVMLENGTKELIAILDGYRESKSSWMELLLDIRDRGLVIAPKLATGDGALGFWAAVEKVYPETEHQRCWVHKTANILTRCLPACMRRQKRRAMISTWPRQRNRPLLPTTPS